ncbi:hypothetical protein FA15DRAFT_744704 [Coprinopsis marcescibilis]|uniref:Fungal-type protein kinase domain-containing protein n=1 Tax=Coprinopsis marcescibilis TaxID=230819 RepID=A0A5C3L931_COPMA|nr:hypothetical protein FA15DRAFT_744704 [Coprinopsis marcescibilis]
MSNSQPQARTPERKVFQSNGQTPRKTQPLSQRITAHTTPLENQRDLRMANVRGHTFSCPLDDWFSAFLEDKDNGIWSARMSSDVRKQLDQKVFNRNGWVALAAKFAKKPVPKEDAVYSTLKPIYKAIIEKAKELHGGELVATALFRTTPNEVPELDVLGTKTRPDGQSTLVVPPADNTSVGGDDLFSGSDSSEKLQTSKQASLCAGIYEFKKSEADRPKNNQQMVHGASQLFYNDPRRRFTYGMTIEKTSTRLWYFNHTFICISNEFDCNKNPEAFIRFFLYMTFASETQLGFDPTVKRCEENGKVYFRYKVEDKFYRTIGNPIAEESAWLMNSRAVRVWTVRSVDKDCRFLEDDKEEHVLKDVRLYDDIMSEKDNQERILEAAKVLDETSPVASGKQSRNSQLRELFLTILHDWRVQVDKDNKQVEDITSPRPDSARHIFLETLVSVVQPKASAGIRVSEQQAPHPETEILANNINPELEHHRRIHRRVVFQEKCKTFCQIDSFTLALRSLYTYVLGLNIFRQIGFLHRDISTGNCLVYVREGRKPIPKISDLEYCKLYEEISEHDPVTGTPEFMATEVRKKALLFVPAPTKLRGSGKRKNARRDLDDLDKIPEQPIIPLNTGGQEDTDEVPLFHAHYYHDLEGIIWLFVWFFLSFIPQSFSEKPSMKQVSDWRCCFSGLFEGDSTDERRKLFDSVGTLKKKIKEWGWHQNLRPLFKVLGLIPELKSLYSELEGTLQDKVHGAPDCHRWSNDKFNDDIYDEFTERLFDALVAVNGIDSNVRSIWDHPDVRRHPLQLKPHNEASVGIKRSANNNDSEDAGEEQRR